MSAAVQNVRSAETRLLHCRLPDLDPWDRGVQRYLNPLKDPLKACKKNYTQITAIKGGHVVLQEKFRDDGTECEFRSLSSSLRVKYFLTDASIR